MRLNISGQDDETEPMVSGKSAWGVGGGCIVWRLLVYFETGYLPSFETRLIALCFTCYTREVYAVTRREIPRRVTSRLVTKPPPSDSLTRIRLVDVALLRTTAPTFFTLCLYRCINVYR